MVKRHKPLRKISANFSLDKWRLPTIIQTMKRIMIFLVGVLFIPQVFFAQGLVTFNMGGVPAMSDPDLQCEIYLSLLDGSTIDITPQDHQHWTISQYDAATGNFTSDVFTTATLTQQAPWQNDFPEVDIGVSYMNLPNGMGARFSQGFADALVSGQNVTFNFLDSSGNYIGTFQVPEPDAGSFFFTGDISSTNIVERPRTIYGSIQHYFPVALTFSIGAISLFALVRWLRRSVSDDTFGHRQNWARRRWGKT